MEPTTIHNRHKDGEIWIQSPKRKRKAQEYRRHRDLAIVIFPNAWGLAKDNGLRLTQITKFQFDLSDVRRTWLLHILPAHRRYFGHPDTKRKPPLIGLKDDNWNLVEVVQAAISNLATEKDSSQQNPLSPACEG